MPELPEVETIKNDLEKKILDIRILDIEVKLLRTVKNKLSQLKRELIGNKFIKIERIGKLMVFHLEKGEHKLLIHLKMTGQLVYCKGKRVIAGGHDDHKGIVCLPHKWTRVVFTFADKSQLFFNDMRTFGYMKLVSPKELDKNKSNFGIEPLSNRFTANALTGIVEGRIAPIKAVLMNQVLIAGIGNIYADEALFEAGIMPDRKAGTLKPKEVSSLHKAIKAVLRKAIRFRGTTFNNYVDADGNRGDFVRLLKVYGRAGEKCKRCKTGVIEKTKVAQRGTHVCNKCQR
jgi:formamidopyrimidine-DNA glycosylase